MGKSANLIFCVNIHDMIQYRDLLRVDAKHWGDNSPANVTPWGDDSQTGTSPGGGNSRGKRKGPLCHMVNHAVWL